MLAEAARWRRRLLALLPRGAAILWLGVATLILLSLPLLALYARLSGDCAHLRAAVVAAQIVTAEPAALEELTALRTAVAEGTAAEAALQRELGGSIAWTALLERVVPPSTAGIRLLALEQSGSEVELRGEADGEAALLAYEARLRSSPLCQSVELRRGLARTGAAAFAITLRLRGYEP